MQIFCTVLILLLLMTLLVVDCAPAPGIVLTPTAHPRPLPTAMSGLDTITGTFENQISILESNMPRARSEAYVVPINQEETDFGNLVTMIANKDLARAAELATQDHYTLNYYVDHGDQDATSYLLREQKPIQKGWGLYAFRVDSTSNIIVEAPHPRYDKRTPSVALNVYRALHARALLIAGAHRNANHDGSADVAHAAESIFQSVHMALSREIQTKSGDVIILQIHGFHSTKHQDYPQVVFGLGSNAQAEEVALAEKLREALADWGITSGLCLGDTLQDLCAETNIQNAVTKDGRFLHIELDENLRKDDQSFIAALMQIFQQ